MAHTQKFPNSRKIKLNTIDTYSWTFSFGIMVLDWGKDKILLIQVVMMYYAVDFWCRTLMQYMEDVDVAQGQ